MNNDVNAIISLVGKRSGFLMNRDNRSKIESLVRRRIRLTGMKSDAAYLEHLNSIMGATELSVLQNHLTIGETFFFRNQFHWRAFREFALPTVSERAKETGRPLRFWSAACSTGEEPYTMAICLWEEQYRCPTNGFTIQATDIDQKAIAHGKRGGYTEHSFRGVEQSVINAYFVKKKGLYHLRNRIRRLVDFETLNLVSSNAYPRRYHNMDIIFCRNALMYFQPKIALRVLEQLVSCLRSGGFLFLGHSEGFIVPDYLLTRLKSNDTFLFQKREIPKQRQYFEIAPRIQPNLPIVPTPHIKIDALTPDPAALTSRIKIDAPIPVDTGHICIHGDTDRTKVSEVQTENRAIPVGRQILQAESVGEEPQKERDWIYRKAFDHYLHEEFEPALALLSKAGDDTQKELRELLLIGLLFYNMTCLDQAEEYWHKVYERSDTAPEGYVLESLIKEAREESRNAMKANRKAIFLDRNFFAPHFRMGVIYRNAGNPVKACKHFVSALKVLETDHIDRVRLFNGPVTPSFLKETIGRYVEKINIR